MYIRISPCSLVFHSRIFNCCTIQILDIIHHLCPFKITILDQFCPIIFGAPFETWIGWLDLHFCKLNSRNWLARSSWLVGEKWWIWNGRWFPVEKIPSVHWFHCWYSRLDFLSQVGFLYIMSPYIILHIYIYIYVFILTWFFHSGLNLHAWKVKSQCWWQFFSEK